MRQLRLTRVADDTGELVLDSVDGLESYLLPVDDVLRAAVAKVLTPAPVAPVAPATPPAAPASSGEVSIGPREIQMRVRAGESPQELADSLGVTVDRVMRFAGPVMDERLRITDEARRARARRAGSESELVQFGETVDARFTAHGLVPGEVAWDSRRREDGDWIVTAEWSGGEGRHGADWLFHRGTRLVTPLDDTAGDLLSDRPIRPVAPPAPPVTTLSAAPPLVPGVVAFPPMPDAHTGPLPRYQEVFDQDAPVDGPRDVPPLIPGFDVVETEYDEPPLPLGITDESTRPDAATVARLTNVNRRESEDDKAVRARIPSWDDILLGVRRKD